MTKNSDLQQRIQQDLMRISAGLIEGKLHYDWFKLRGSDGGEIPMFPKITRPR